MKNIKNSCSGFSPVVNQHLVSYMNSMELVVQKPPQCKGCMYYTSKDCGNTFPSNHVEREFFC